MRTEAAAATQAASNSEGARPNPALSDIAVAYAPTPKKTAKPKETWPANPPRMFQPTLAAIQTRVMKTRRTTLGPGCASGRAATRKSRRTNPACELNLRINGPLLVSPWFMSSAAVDSRVRRSLQGAQREQGQEEKRQLPAGIRREWREC